LISLGLPEESVHMLDPNLVLVLRFNEDTGDAWPLTQHTVYEFDVRQFKTSTEDWRRAFHGAVRKRTTSSKHPIFVGLSSGYDSGALHLALENEAAAHSVNYFTVVAEELSALIQERIEGHNSSVARAWWLDLSLADFMLEKEWLLKYAEPFRYSEDNWAGGSVQEDGAAIGSSAIFRRCRRAGLLVYLSGAGADEIISDYGFGGERLFPHSSFGGLFPLDLDSLFPWRSVFLGTQRDYIMKEEVVAGSHGLEARYPFLDKAVVQEFLWLSAETKNAVYKRPVHDLLVGARYPFAEGKKEGFAAGRNLRLVGKTAAETIFDAHNAADVESTDFGQNVASTVVPTAQTATASPLSEESAATWCSATAELWTSTRSRLVAFLAVPEDNFEIVESLGGQLLETMGRGMAEDGDPDGEHGGGCVLGELCLRLLLLLLMEPAARRRQLRNDGTVLWSTLRALPWEQAVRSGWPVFGLLRRLAGADNWSGAHDATAAAEAPAAAAAELWQQQLGAIVPLSGCGGRMLDETELNVPLAVLAASTDPLHLGRTQRAMLAFWDSRQEQSLAEVLSSARMCEAFATLERLSERHYRVHFGDAWHLLG